MARLVSSNSMPCEKFWCSKHAQRHSIFLRKEILFNRFIASVAEYIVKTKFVENHEKLKIFKKYQLFKGFSFP